MMAATVIKIVTYLGIAMTTVHSQDLRGQPSGFSRNSRNFDTSPSSSQHQLLRQQPRNQLLSRIQEPQLSDVRGQLTSRLDQSDLQNSPTFGLTRRASRLSRLQNQQDQGDQFSQQKLDNQQEQRQRQQGTQQQRRQQKLQEQFQQHKLQVLRQQQPQQNVRPSNNPGTRRQDQRRQLNQQIGKIDSNGRFVQLSPAERERLTNQRGELDSQIRPSGGRNPAFQSQRNLQQRFLGGDRRVGFGGQGSNFRSQQFPRNSFRPFFEPITGRAQMRNPSRLSGLVRPMQQPFSQHQRADDMLRQQQIEKERSELSMLQKKQQDELKNQRLQPQQQDEMTHQGLQHQQQQIQQQHIQQQQNQQQQNQQQREQQPREQLPVPGSTDVGAALANPKDNFVRTIEMASSANNSLITDASHIKRERIQQLADLLGFRPSDLLTAVAELEASKRSLVTNVIPAAEKGAPLPINEGSTVRPLVEMATTAWASATNSLNVPLATKDAGFGGSVSVATNDSAAPAGAGSAVLDPPATGSVALDRTSIAATVSVVLDPTSSTATGSVVLDPAAGASTGSVVLDPAAGASTGSVVLDPAAGASTGSIVLDPAAGASTGSVVLDPAAGASTGSVVNDPATKTVTGSEVLNPAANAAIGSVIHNPAGSNVTGSVVVGPATSTGAGSMPAGVDSAGPNEWKLNELIRQMAIDLLSKRTQLFKMEPSSSSFVSNTTNQQTASTIVTTTSQSILDTQSPTITPTEGAYIVVSNLISNSVVTTPSNYAINEPSARTVTGSTLSPGPGVSRELTSATAPVAATNATEQKVQQDLTTAVQNMLHTLITQSGTSGTAPSDATFSVASKALLAEIQNHFSASNSTTASRSNSSRPVTPNSNTLSAFTTVLPTHLGPNTTNSSGENGTIRASVDLFQNGTEVLNATSMNFTMTTPAMTTESLNTTAAATEATEAVPTAPPPPPGFPHMFEPLPGQELTEAQLEYNEMREAQMAR